MQFIYVKKDQSKTVKANFPTPKYETDEYLIVQEDCPFNVCTLVDNGDGTGAWEDATDYDAIAYDERSALLRQEKKLGLRASIFIDGQEFDADEAAEMAYIKFFIALSIDNKFVVDDWKASNGDYVTMDAVLFTKIMAAIKNRDIPVFAHYKAEMGKL